MSTRPPHAVAAASALADNALGSIERARAAAWFLVARVFGGDAIAAAGSLVSTAVPAAVSVGCLGE